MLRVLLEVNPDEPVPGQRKAALVPFVKEIVPVVSQALRMLEITPPDGLIEATTTIVKDRSRGRKLKPVSSLERTNTPHPGHT